MGRRALMLGHEDLLLHFSGLYEFVLTERSSSGILHWRFGDFFNFLIDGFLQATIVSG
jgi:hypothetical protein